MGTRNTISRGGRERERRVVYLPHDRGARPNYTVDTPFPAQNDLWELFTERLRNDPINLSHGIPVHPYQPFHVMIDEDEFWTHGRAMSPALQHFVRASPLRFSNRFDNDYVGRQLTPAEVNTVLQKIKTEVYKPISRNSGKEQKEKAEDDPTPHTCSICLEDFFAKQQLHCLPCKHRFHPECLMPWIKRQGQCPVCRLDLTGRPPSVNNQIPNANHGDQAQNLNQNTTDEIALIIRDMEEVLTWINPYQH